MTLDENDLRNGKLFIVGSWQPDFVVNLFSNTLDHIPAAEFKSNDGTDFTALRFEFFEDNTLEVVDAAKGTTLTGTWEQTGYGKYKYDLAQLDAVPEGPFKDAVTELTVQDGNLAFSLGFLLISLKKTADGTVTEAVKQDIGDIEPTEADLALKEIVGVWKTEKLLSFGENGPVMLTRAEAEAENLRRIAAGELDELEAADTLKQYDNVVEFTDDHRVIWWIRIPAGVTDAELKAALDSGEIMAVRDGLVALSSKEWKAVGGKYYYNTEEHREVFGEVLSPWDELVIGSDGLLPMSDGMVLLRRKD